MIVELGPPPALAEESLEKLPDILYKLRLQRASLRARLEVSQHPSIREVDALQSGIFWTGWLETQLTKPRKSPRPASQDEADLIRAIQASFEGVGSGPQG